MSGFSIEWLNLREKADQRARDAALKQHALDWLGLGRHGAVSINNIPLSPAEAIVVDLGAGTGATLRAPSAPGSQQVVWRLVDTDGDLLDEAIKRHGKDFRIEDYQSDLAIVGELPLGGARLITASALFDLMSAQFVTALVKRLSSLRTGWPCALYAALNYDGTTRWEPVHPYDDAVLDAFNRDQRRDKGTGVALGPDSAPFLLQALTKAGFTVLTANTPWRLDATDAAMVEALVNGIADAVHSGHGLDASKLQEWKQFRLVHAATGTCTVGHVDVLALP